MGQQLKLYVERIKEMCTKETSKKEEVYMTTEEENLKARIKYLEELLEVKKQHSFCVVIDQPIEEFGIERCQQLEKQLDEAVVPIGFKRTGSGKLENQTVIFFRCFAEAV